jgi:hypothetical protein
MQRRQRHLHAKLLLLLLPVRLRTAHRPLRGNQGTTGDCMHKNGALQQQQQQQEEGLHGVFKRLRHNGHLRFQK